MKIDVERLELLRTGFRENPREFAKRIGLSHAWYYQLIRKNGGQNPSLKTLHKIARALNIEPRDLLK